MKSEENMLRKLRLRQFAATVAVIALTGLLIWSSFTLPRHDRIVIDVFYGLAWIALVAYIGRVVIPAQMEVKRSRVE